MNVPHHEVARTMRSRIVLEDVEPAVPYEGPIKALMSPYEPGCSCPHAATHGHLGGCVHDTNPHYTVRRFATGGIIRGGQPVFLNEYADYRIAPGERAIRTRDSERARAKACGQIAPFLGATPLEAAANLMVKLGHCPHGEAEEVVLCTGDVVAAVCPSCWETLPPSFVGSGWKP